MRITFVLPYAGMAGGMRVLATYAERLHRRGHEVLVVSLPLRRVRWRHRVRSILLGNGWPRQPRPEPSYFDGLAVPHRILAENRPVTDADVPKADVVIATYWRTIPWVARLAPEKGAKVFFAQGYEVLPGQTDSDLDAAWATKLYKIVISKWLVDVARSFGDDNVTHVPNSVDLAQFYAPPRRKQACPTVGFLYSTSPLKGCDISIQAIECCRRAIPGLRVVAFGAERPTCALPIPDNASFFFRPPQAQIRTIYDQCDVWLCGSRCEGFHLPPLEAMACRCPVVSTRVGGPLDVIEDGLNGYIVDVEDVESLSCRLLSVLQMPQDRWRSMSDAANATARRYTWDDATDLFEKALGRAMRRVRQSTLATCSKGVV